MCCNERTSVMSELHEPLEGWFGICNSNHPGSGSGVAVSATLSSLSKFEVRRKIPFKHQRLESAVVRHHLISTPCRSARIEKIGFGGNSIVS